MSDPSPVVNAIMHCGIAFARVVERVSALHGRLITGRERVSALHESPIAGREGFLAIGGRPASSAVGGVRVHGARVALLCQWIQGEYMLSLADALLIRSLIL